MLQPLRSQNQILFFFFQDVFPPRTRESGEGSAHADKLIVLEGISSMYIHMRTRKLIRTKKPFSDLGAPPKALRALLHLRPALGLQCRMVVRDQVKKKNKIVVYYKQIFNKLFPDLALNCPAPTKWTRYVESDRLFLFHLLVVLLIQIYFFAAGREGETSERHPPHFHPRQGAVCVLYVRKSFRLKFIHPKGSLSCDTQAR